LSDQALLASGKSATSSTHQHGRVVALIRLRTHPCPTLKPNLRARYLRIRATHRLILGSGDAQNPTLAPALNLARGARDPQAPPWRSEHAPLRRRDPVRLRQTQIWRRYL